MLQVNSKYGIITIVVDKKSIKMGLYDAKSILLMLKDTVDVLVKEQCLYCTSPASVGDVQMIGIRTPEGQWVCTHCAPVYAMRGEE